MNKAFLKYLEVARTNLRSMWAYVWDQLVSSIHLAIIMFVFVQLWKTTYAAGGQQAFSGYSLAEIIWYLVATEAVIMSMPRIHRVLEQEVKEGDLAIRLNKPYNYLLFHYAAFLGEGLMRLAIALFVGGATAWLSVGPFHFRWQAIPGLLLVYLTTQALHFFYSGSIGLAAFWMEDISGLFLLLDKVKWLAGGLLLPLEIYPDAARKVVEWLPFRYMIAGPARLFVKFSWGGAGQLLMNQAVWLVLFGLVCVGLYRLGVRRVDVNGG